MHWIIRTIYCLYRCHLQFGRLRKQENNICCIAHSNIFQKKRGEHLFWVCALIHTNTVSVINCASTLRQVGLWGSLLGKCQSWFLCLPMKRGAWLLVAHLSHLITACGGCRQFRVEPIIMISWLDNAIQWPCTWHVPFNLLTLLLLVANLANTK